MAAGRLVDEGDPERVALLLPGRAYTPEMPLFFFTRALLRRDGWTIRAVDWGQLPSNADLVGDHLLDVAAPALDGLVSHGQRLVVAKSLGTRLAPLAADRGLAGVWLTPLLNDDEDQCAAYAEMTGPALLVGGTADPFWSTDEADVLRASGWGRPPAERSIVELPGLDHGLEVPGDPVASVRSCAEVMGHVESFLARQGSRGA